MRRLPFGSPSLGASLLNDALANLVLERSPFLSAERLALEDRPSLRLSHFLPASVTYFSQKPCSG